MNEKAESQSPPVSDLPEDLDGITPPDDEDARISPASLGWILGSLLLVVLGAWVYAPIVRDGWTRYDNVGLIANEPKVKDLSGAGIKNIFTHYHHDLYQPLLTLSLAIDYNLFKRGPRGHETAAWPETDLTGWHIHSLAIHLVTLVLLFLLIGRMTGHVLAAWVGTALVALHPLLVEPVSWMICRTFLVAGFWIVLGCHLYLSHARRPRWWLYLLSLICFGLSMLAKLHMGLFLFVLLFDLWCNRHKWGWIIAEKVPLLCMAGGLVYLNYKRMFGDLRAEPLPEHGFRELLHRGLVGLSWTASNSFFPQGLSVFYGPDENPEWATVSRSILGAAVILLILVVVIITLAKRRKELLLCALGWCVLFVPMLAAIRVRETVAADRYSYVPLWMLGLAVAWLLARWSGGPERKESGTLAESMVLPRKASAWAPLVLLLVLCGWFVSQSRAQARVWSDDVALWEAAVARTPHRTAYGQLANALITEAKTLRSDEQAEQRDALMSRAEQALQAGLELSPDDGNLLENWGVLCLSKADDWGRKQQAALEAGDSDAARKAQTERTARSEQARDLYKRATEVRPASASGWNGLGVALMRQGKNEEAKAALVESVTRAPAYVTAQRNLASVLKNLRLAAESDAARQQSAESVEALRLALTEEAQHLERMGHRDEAGQLRNKAALAGTETADAGDPEALRARGNQSLELIVERAAQMQMLTPQLARAPADQKPQFEAALAEAQSDIQKYSQIAEESFTRLIEVLPESSSAWHGLGQSFMYQNKHDEASDAFARAVQLDNTNAAAVADWARLMAFRQRFDEAAIMLEKALEIDPELGPALLDLAKIYARQQKLDEAAQLLERLVEQEPDNAYNKMFLRLLYQKLGRTEDADRLMQPAPAQQP